MITLRDAARRVVISADQGETGLTASDALEALREALAPTPSVRDDSMELAHIVHGASDLGWNLSMELAERLWTAGVRVVEDAS